MHKSYLNSEEIKLIKGADKIIDKIGGFPSMENGYLESFSIKNNGDFSKWNGERSIDVELVFNINGWLETLDFYKGHGEYYDHKDFDERHIKMCFHNCREANINYSSIFHNGEIKFGGYKEVEVDNRKQDAHPCIERIIERPYCCFYIVSGRELYIEFEEDKCEISAEINE